MTEGNAMRNIHDTTTDTHPGALDLSERLSDHPILRVEIAAARAQCDADGHPAGCYNPGSDTTYCRCGFVQYPGNCAPFPVPRRIEACGKFDR
jgi:hypothetical protein